MSTIRHKGRVLDHMGKPIWNAHVITVNSPKRGVTTDNQGYFTVEGTLLEAWEITHIGYQSRLFRLERNVPNTTYRLTEDAYELDGVTVTPPVSTTPKTSGLSKIFEVVNSIFTTPTISTQTPGYVPPKIPQVPTFQMPIAPTGNGTIAAETLNTRKAAPNYAPASQKDSISDWVSNNPVKAGSILLAAIIGGSMLLKKKS